MLHTPARLLIDPRWFAAYAASANGPVEGTEMTVVALAVQPHDYLPPQTALNPTAWRDSGFRVGPLGRDVCADLPGAAGRVLLFGPLGVLDVLAHYAVVTVVRPD
jgi:hypothetical protein